MTPCSTDTPKRKRHVRVVTAFRGASPQRSAGLPSCLAVPWSLGGLYILLQWLLTQAPTTDTALLKVALFLPGVPPHATGGWGASMAETLQRQGRARGVKSIFMVLRGRFRSVVRFFSLPAHCLSLRFPFWLL